MYNNHIWIDGEVITATKLNNMENGILTNAMDMNLASEFSTDLAYTTGQYVVNYGVLYKFIADKAAGEWDASKVTEITVGAELKDIADEKLTEAKLDPTFAASLAKVDGSYEGMTVGNAEQLVSTVGVEDSAPYTFRTTGGSADVGDRMNLKKVVGGTVAWNQLVQTNSASVNVPSGHKYLSRINGTNTIAISNGSAISINDGTKDNVFDLTAMFGSTIADYVYTLESGTAGAGVAWLKSYGFFTKPYYPYKAAALESVKTSAHKTIGFNQWDEVWEVGGINTTTGANNDSLTDRIRSKNYIPVVGGQNYYFKAGTDGQTSWQINGVYYDGNKNVIDSFYVRNDYKFIPNNCAYIRFMVTSGYGTTYKNDICINIHWDGERDGEYEPYEQHTYALDEVELRGIPKLDASNNLYYDGDQYTPDGTVARKRGYIEYDGSSDESWSLLTTIESLDIYKIDIVGAVTITNEDTAIRIVSNRESVSAYTATHTGRKANTVALVGSNRIFYAVPTGTYANITAFKSALSSNPLQIDYELATLTTESADAYTELQICNDFGTEEFVDAATRDFDMPCGSLSVYQSNLRAKLEMAPNSPANGNGDYIVRQTDGVNEYVLFSEVKELPDLPTTDGTYVLKCTVADGTATLSWVSE